MPKNLPDHWPIAYILSESDQKKIEYFVCGAAPGRL